MSGEIATTAQMWTDLIHKLAAPAAEELGLIFGEKARAYRLRNLVSVTEKAKRKLRDAELSENAVPPRLLLPIIENCSVEDDESLQDKWAGLLATASQEGDSVSPSFIETLKQLTPDEARYLDEIYVGILNRVRDARRRNIRTLGGLTTVLAAISGSPIASRKASFRRHVRAFGPDPTRLCGVHERTFQR